MNLRQQAIADVRSLFGDDAYGPASPVVVTSPDNDARIVRGIPTDIGEEIDPGTGMSVAGRKASVAFSVGALAAAGLGIPVNITDQSRVPWLVAFDDSEGVRQTYKVMDTRPDTALGLVVCMLELYQP